MVEGCEAVADGAHGVFAYAPVDVAAAVGAWCVAVERGVCVGVLECEVVG